MTSVFEPARDAERKQRETFDVQQSLLDDPPVLVRATRSAVEQLVAREPHKLEVAGSSPARALLPGATNGRSALPPFTAERPQAEPTDPRTDGSAFALTACPTDRNVGGAGRGSALTNDNGTRRSTCPGSAAGASQETS